MDVNKKANVNEIFAQQLVFRKIEFEQMSFDVRGQRGGGWGLTKQNVFCMVRPKDQVLGHGGYQKRRGFTTLLASGATHQATHAIAVLEKASGAKHTMWQAPQTKLQARWASFAWLGSHCAKCTQIWHDQLLLQRCAHALRTIPPGLVRLLWGG